MIKYIQTRRLKAIPWDALARERCIGMNYEVTVKCNDKLVRSAIEIIEESHCVCSGK